MQVIVYRLRRNGCRLPESTWVNAPIGPGRIVLASTQGIRHLTYHPDGTSRSDADLSLYEPSLVTLGSDRMRFRGFESINRGDDVVGVVQEWICEMYRPEYKRDRNP